MRKAMITTDEYAGRFRSIISAWEAPKYSSYGEQARLMDNSIRFIRKNGSVCGAIEIEGKDETDWEFTHEESLLEETTHIVNGAGNDLTMQDTPALRNTTHTGFMAVSADTQSLIESSISHNTALAYKRALSGVGTYLQGKPISDALLADYITFLHNDGKSPSTINQVFAAVKWQAKNQGVHIVWTITLATLKGIRREGKSRGRGQVDGLNWTMVERVCAFAESEGTCMGLRDCALIRLTSDCLLRVSEAVAVNITDLKGATLRIESSKTDQEGKGANLFITSTTRQAIKKYIEAAGITSGPLFRPMSNRGDKTQGRRLSSERAREAIKRRAHDAGIEGFISGHSLRVGSAMSLTQEGASVVDMQIAGRWKSSQMPAHYAAAEIAEKGPIARLKEGKY